MLATDRGSHCPPPGPPIPARIPRGNKMASPIDPYTYKRPTTEEYRLLAARGNRRGPPPASLPPAPDRNKSLREIKGHSNGAHENQPGTKNAKKSTSPLGNLSSLSNNVPMRVTPVNDDDDDEEVATLMAKIRPVESRRFAHWTPGEDMLLRKAVELEKGPPHNWKRIASKYFLDSRNAFQCKGRWNKKVKPGLKRQRWSREEDEIIIRSKADGLDWRAIANLLTGRRTDHVRDRFVNYIDPTLLKTPMSQYERNLIVEYQAKLGNKWTEIAKLLPGRSENMVKNCWHNAKMVQRRARYKEAQLRAQTTKGSNSSSEDGHTTLEGESGDTASSEEL